jgi:hypothetical protein
MKNIAAHGSKEINIILKARVTIRNASRWAFALSI